MIRLFLYTIMLAAAGQLTAQQMSWKRLAEDTAYYAREYNPEYRFPMQPGPAQAWDFRSLRAPYALSRKIHLTGSDRNPTGHLMHGSEIEAILQLNGTASTVYQVMEDNPVCKGEKLVFTMTPAYKPFFKGVIGESYAYRGKMVSTFAWPKHINCLYTPPRLPDSCRVTYAITQDILVDGEGTVYLPTEINSAYRQHVTTKRAARVEISYGPIWKDITHQVPGVRLLVTEDSYRYVSSGDGMLLADVLMNENQQPVRIEFKTHPIATRIVAEESTKPDIYAFPNPSFDIVRFQLSDLTYGKYKLKIFNILGTPIRELDVYVDDPRKTITMDLGDLQRGTYLYRLQDSHGRTIRTKRVTLIQA
jgi:hypothetical protein